MTDSRADPGLASQHGRLVFEFFCKSFSLNLTPLFLKSYLLNAFVLSQKSQFGQKNRVIEHGLGTYLSSRLFFSPSNIALKSG